LLQTLKAWFRERPDVYVSGSVPVGFRHNTRSVFVWPDVFVVPGVGGHDRAGYRLWEEGRGLDFLLEVVSMPTTKRTEERRALHVEKLSVKEYVLFDPRGEHLDPPLQLHRRSAGGFRPVKPAGGRLASKVLGLELECSGYQLWFHDPATTNRLPLPPECADARARLIAGEIEYLKTEIERLRGEGRTP
jgi:Uma2 family endonuclease